MAHQIAVQRSKATGRKFSVVVDYNLLTSIPHYASGLSISDPKLDLWQMSMAALSFPSCMRKFRRCCPIAMEINAYPERGFLINKQLLQSHGYVVKEKSIVSLRLLKGHRRSGGGRGPGPAPPQSKYHQ